MEFLAAGLSTLITVFILALFAAGVMKLFQIHSVLTEIKDSLRSTGVPRATSPSFDALPAYKPATSAPAAPVPLHSMSSGDEMLRALDAQMKWEETGSRSDR